MKAAAVAVKYVITLRKYDDSVETFVKESRWNSNQMRAYIVRTYGFVRYVYIIATIDGVIPEDKFRNAELPSNGGMKA
jgi:hypothetical protein